VASQEPSPWDAVEDRLAEIGVLAGMAERYRLVRERGGPALLDRGLALAAEARRLYRSATGDANEVARLAARCGETAACFGTLLDAARAAPEYVAAVAARRHGDVAALVRLIPAVFADVEPATGVRTLYHPVATTARGSRVRETDGLAAELSRLCTEGIPAAEPGEGPGTDDALTAVILYDDWERVDSPVAVGLDAAALGRPIFRVADSTMLLVYAERAAAAGAAVVLARAPGADRWPDLGTEYADFATALRAALDRRGCPYRLAE
jgi:hypothetical protein